MIRNAIQRFMYGRYGSDQLNQAMIAVYLVLLILYMLSGFVVLYYLTFALMVLTLFRMLSRNFPARRAENARFLKAANPVVRWWRLQRTIRRDKEHCYFKCPSCGQHLRVPKGKGRITVTCRGCGASFQEKS